MTGVFSASSVPEKIPRQIAAGFALSADFLRRVGTRKATAAFETNGGRMALDHDPFGLAATWAERQRRFRTMPGTTAADDAAAGIELEGDAHVVVRARQGAGGTQPGAQRMIAAAGPDGNGGQCACGQAAAVGTGKFAKCRQQAFARRQRTNLPAQGRTRAGRRLDGAFAASDFPAEPAEESAPPHGDLAGG